MSIPSLSDYMAEVQNRLVANASFAVDPEIVANLSEVFTSDPATDADLFNFMAFAVGCHAAAEEYRLQGQADLAGLYHAMGQDLLTKAMLTFGLQLAAGLDFAGIVRH
ncbi:hypothetical protein EOA79_04545 [Mesorhizobium sp. M1A.F.Ca.IN.020.03.2.1]|uniref:hypothetical protein n=1 Tax=Mesorhizobium sp. M1A.F.Ca.IN.020.03.2.1 TaxID=2496769 RepID=UPI000FD27A1D|nr:hypothetical protein [Mesorhizobium sp. M1A.F.Ca.IN.020.03.2.1]RUV07440.1 hypothetical protein EOA79_04545 [Mesorhizobium sp. M1A.F.Ca.IN.020.03.2.1]